MSEDERRSDALSQQRCAPCEGGVGALAPQQVARLLLKLHGWSRRDHPERTAIERTFSFQDYSQVLAFANAVAWMAIRENHHPILEVHFNRCIVSYYTHALGGLSENDFICAAKVDTLYEG